MSRSRHTVTQVVAALQQVEAERTTDGVGRKQGVSKHTSYAWKAKYGAVTDARRSRVWIAWLSHVAQWRFHRFTPEWNLRSGF